MLEKLLTYKAMQKRYACFEVLIESNVYEYKHKIQKYNL